MVRIFVYSNQLILRHELVLDSVGKMCLGVFKIRVSVRVGDILRLLGKEDLHFTLGDNIEDVDDESKLYLVLDTDSNKFIETFTKLLDLVISFA